MPDFPIAVVPAKRWRNPATGRVASVGGAYPGDGFILETSGFTTSNNDGTTGSGRVPFASRDECLAFANRWRERWNLPPLV
jgi:hypothetical protein